MGAMSTISASNSTRNILDRCAMTIWARRPCKYRSNLTPKPFFFSRYVRCARCGLKCKWYFDRGFQALIHIRRAQFRIKTSWNYTYFTTKNIYSLHVMHMRQRSTITVHKAGEWSLTYQSWFRLLYFISVTQDASSVCTIYRPQHWHL